MKMPYSSKGTFLSRSIKTQVTIFSLVIFVTSIWALGLYAGAMLRKDFAQSLADQQLATVSLLARNLNAELIFRFNALETRASHQPTTIIRNPAVAQALIDERPVLQSLFNGGIFISGLDGTVVASNVPAVIGKNYADRQYMIDLFKSGKSVISQPLLGKVRKLPLVVMATPLRDEEGQVLGVVAGVIDLSKPSFIEYVMESHYGKTGGYELFAPRYRLVVTATDKSRVMTSQPPQGSNAMVDRFNDGVEGTEIGPNPLGVEVMASMAKIPAAGWGLIAALPLEEAFSPIRDMQKRLLFATIALTLLAGAMTWWMLRRQLGALLGTSKVLDTMLVGDQQLRPLHYPREDEIGRLVAGFNTLVRRMQAKDDALQEAQRIAKVGSWQLDVATGSVVWSNELYRMVGLDPMLSAPDYSKLSGLFTPESAQRMNDAVSRAAKDGVPYQIELEIVKPDGGQGWMFARGEAVRDANGSIVELRGTATDISGRKQIENALRVSDSALKTISQGVIITGPDQLVFSVNAAFLATTGYSEGEVMGRNCRFLQGELTDRRTVADIRTAIETHTEFNGEILNYRKDGQAFWNELTIAPVFGEAGSLSHLIGITRDITERKKVEAEVLSARDAAANANNAKSEFLANMSHEIRTPMNGILGLTALSLEGRFDEEKRELIVRANESAKSLLVILNDILDFNKIESGKLAIESIPFDLLRCLEQPRALFASIAIEKGISFEMTIDPKVPAYVSGDPTRLTQILNNLLSNAIKFTERGSVTLSVSLQQEPHIASVGDDTVALQFEVRDSGIGITPEQQRRLFQPFEQAESSTSRKYGGTGLGLVISRRLAELMHGSLTLESAQGLGSTFRLTLAFARTDAVLESNVSATEELATKLNGLRLLLVEDNKTNVLVATKYLERYGVLIDVAENGKLGLEELRNNPDRYAGVLMDVQMPVMNGWEATRLIRDELHYTKPIIAMTAGVMKEERDKCLDAGMNDFIVKPIDVDQMVATLVDHFTKSSAPNLRVGISATPAAQEKSVFSVDSMMAAASGDPAFRLAMINIVQSLVDKGQTPIEEARKLWLENRREDAATKFHSMRGSIGSLGAKRFAEATLKIESQLHATPSGDELNLFVEVTQELDAVLVAARAWLALHQAKE